MTWRYRTGKADWRAPTVGPWPWAHREALLRQRTGEAFEQKHVIARWAASVIVPGENILLNVGSTVGALAHELRGFEKPSVTTPGTQR